MAIPPDGRARTGPVVLMPNGRRDTNVLVGSTSPFPSDPAEAPTASRIRVSADGRDDSPPTNYGVRPVAGVDSCPSATLAAPEQ
jgi:hypothetical protein